jgi:hypothetical protein
MNKDKNIIAIGGGGSEHNFSIYEYAVNIIKKKKSRALLIPTSTPVLEPTNIWGD